MPVDIPGAAGPVLTQGPEAIVDDDEDNIVVQKLSREIEGGVTTDVGSSVDEHHHRQKVPLRQVIG